MDKLILSVTKNESRNFIELNEATKNKILQKHDSKCSACNISLPSHAHFHEEGSKIIPLCVLCYYPLHVDRIVSREPGKVILLPEMSQIELNATLRAMEYIRLKSYDIQADKHNEFTEIADAVEIIEVLFKDRAEMAEGFYAEGISNVNLLSQVLCSLSDEDYAKRETGLYGLRFMHNMSIYGNEMQSWESQLSKFKPAAWRSLVKKISESRI